MIEEYEAFLSGAPKLTFHAVFHGALSRQASSSLHTMSDRFYQSGRAFLDQTVRLYYRRIEVGGREGIPAPLPRRQPHRTQRTNSSGAGC